MVRPFSFSDTSVVAPLLPVNASPLSRSLFSVLDGHPRSPRLKSPFDSENAAITGQISLKAPLPKTDG